MCVQVSDCTDEARPRPSHYGYDFIAGPFLPSGENEYYLRDRQAALLAAGADAEAAFTPSEVTKWERDSFARWQ
jgi:hypothetical protein